MLNIYLKLQQIDLFLLLKHVVFYNLYNRHLKKKRIMEQPDSWKTNTYTNRHLWPFLKLDIGTMENWKFLYKCPVHSSPVVQMSAVRLSQPIV